jgi:hypothetical protein
MPGAFRQFCFSFFRFGFDWPDDDTFRKIIGETSSFVSREGQMKFLDGGKISARKFISTTDGHGWTRIKKTLLVLLAVAA